MDKLQPILKNHFWILLVPLLSMNLWGYFSANSALKAATTARQGQLDSAKSGIPGGTTDANKKYSEELKKGNDRLEGFVQDELLDLWNRQKTRMVWPPRVAADIPKTYGGEIKERKVRFTYQKDYPEVIQRLHQSVEPFVADKRGITWTPKVDFPIQLIPQVQITDLAIESKPMWDAQEDIWVTQFILDAIREMNKDADSESSAVIRRVIEYRLLGGDGETSGGGEVAAEGDADGGMGGGMGGESMVGSYGGGKRGGGGSGSSEGLGGAGGSGIPSAVKFDPAEEFGKGGEEVSGAGGGGGMNGATMGPMSVAGGEGEGEAESAEEPAGPLRYVKVDDNALFVERGFYLSVIINQNKLVDFLVTLSNSEWPIRVVRFHFGKNPYTTDPFTASRGGAAGGGGSGAGRFGAGGAGMAGMQRMRGGAAAPGMANDGESGFAGLGKGMGARGGRQMPGSSMTGGRGNAASTGYPEDALQQPDLVQLDLAGLITIYRQPKEEVPAEGEAPVDGEAPAEGSSPEEPSDDAAVDAAATTEPATAEPATTDGAAAEAMATDEAPTGDAGTPSTEAPTAEFSAETPIAEGRAEPLAEEADSLPVEPAVEPAAESPPAAEAPPSPDAPAKP